MRTEAMKISKSLWSKQVVRKWLNLKTGAEQFRSDHSIIDNGRRENRSDQDCYVVVPEDFSEGWLKESTNGVKPFTPEKETPRVMDDPLNLRMFVGTWNVGGKSPHEGLNLRNWLKSLSPADIYVIGFQEVVPLNAGNVLGPEDSGPASRWLTLIRQALNGEKFDHQENSTIGEQGSLKPRLSFSDHFSLQDGFDIEGFGKLYNINEASSKENSTTTPFTSGGHCSLSQQPRYRLAVSKQMVGIFLCVWIRSDLYNHVCNLKVSCVSRGIMGYLGNKGSTSISMTVYQTTFCFVCAHLTSGDKDGDEVRRNFDVSEILKKTKFSHPFKALGHPPPPEGILEHDKVIWLGDLNYRLASGRGDTHEQLQKNDWQALLEKDQLRIEQRAGRVFKGWNEGQIHFAPTYKYVANSDDYVAQTSKSKQKRRNPAWCDRILWKGERVKQMWYVRGESKFSDHRPVSSLFSVQVDKTIKKKTTTNAACPSKGLQNAAALSSACAAAAAKVQAEELLLLPTRAQSCIDTATRFIH